MKTNIIRTILLCGTALCVAGPAMAQDSAATGAQSGRTAATADAAVGEVVVTARRREERLQDVPVAVAAFSNETLRRSTVQELRNILVLTPGFTFSNEGGSGNATLTLRGIGQIPLGEGTPSVVTYVNNMALPPDGSNLPTYDISSIQVLKGPQGTLFGKNTLGGALLVTTQAPEHRFGGYISGTYGRYDFRELQGAINVPIVQDKVALRIAGQVRRQDPRLDSFDGGPGNANIHQDAVRISLLVQPVDDLKSSTIAEYYKSDQLSDGTYLLRQNFSFGNIFGPALGAVLDAQLAPQVVAARADRGSRWDGGTNGGYSTAKSKSIVNDTSYQSGAITLRNIFGYRQIRTSERSNVGAVGRMTLPLGPGGSSVPFILFHGGSVSDRQYLTNETQILGDFERFNFISGFYYNNDKPHGPSGSSFTAFSIGGALTPATTSHVRNTNKAIYGQVGFKITDQLTLTAGGRYSWDKASSCGGVFQQDAGTEAQCLAIAGLNNPNDGVGTVKGSSKQPAYTISLDYKITPDWMIYAQHRRGFRAANVNTPRFETWYTTCAGTPIPGGKCFDLRPFQNTGVEKLIDFEVGSKSTFDLGGARSRLNVAAFRDKYDGSLQFLNTTTLIAAPQGSSVPDAPYRSSVGLNVAKETIWGVEGEFSIAPTENLSISVNGAYTHVSIDSISLPPGFPPALYSKANVNKFSPTFSGTISASWTLPFHPLEGDLVLNGDLFTTEPFGGQGGEKLPGYQLANARVDWRKIGGTAVDLSFFVRNLTNEYYIAGAAALIKSLPTSSVYLGAPRTWGVNARYEF